MSGGDVYVCLHVNLSHLQVLQIPSHRQGQPGLYQNILLYFLQYIHFFHIINRNFLFFLIDKLKYIITYRNFVFKKQKFLLRYAQTFFEVFE